MPKLYMRKSDGTEVEIGEIVGDAIKNIASGLNKLSEAAANAANACRAVNYEINLSLKDVKFKSRQIFGDREVDRFKKNIGRDNYNNLSHRNKVFFIKLFKV